MSQLPGQRLLTAEEFAALPDPPDGSQQELDRGRVVTVPPPKGPHGECCVAVSTALRVFAKQHGLGKVFANDTGFIVGRSPDTVRGPDVSFFAKGRLPVTPRDRYIEIPPDLAGEVFSPSDSWGRLQRKVGQYLTAGVRLVWVADPSAAAVTVHTPGELPRVLDNSDEIDGGDVLPGFRCRVSDFFE